MKTNIDKRKLIFLGDTDSINIELIIKSHNFLKDKLKFIIICDKTEMTNYMKKIKSKIKINEILDPMKFQNYKKSQILEFLHSRILCYPHYRI